MVKRRPLRAADIAGSSSTGKNWLQLFFLIIAGIIVFFILYHLSDTGSVNRMEKAREFSEYYKEYFYPRAYTFKIFDDKIPLKMKSTNMGTEFIRHTFPTMISKTEREVKDIMAFRHELNKRDSEDRYSKKAVELGNEHRLFGLIEEGIDISKKTPFNIASGEIHDAWVRAFKRKQRYDALLKKKRRLERLLSFDDKQPGDTEFVADLEKKFEEKEKKEKIPPERSLRKKLKKHLNSSDYNELTSFIEKAISEKYTKKIRGLLLYELLNTLESIEERSGVLPDMKNLRKFIPFAKADNISVENEKGSVKVKNINTSVLLRIFRESLFLDILKEKLPEEMNYIIHLGSRHGIWKLPEKYQRWVVSLDNPYNVLTSPSVAGIALFPESGAFVTTRKREKYFVWEGKEYDLPVDWRTALPEKNNIAAIVIADSAVKGRMLSYALFISDDDELSDVEKQFPDTAFLLLKDRSQVKKSSLSVCPEVAEKLKPYSRPDANVSLTAIRSAMLKTRQELSPEEKSCEKKEITVYYLARDYELYVPESAENAYVPVKDEENEE